MKSTDFPDLFSPRTARDTWFAKTMSTKYIRFASWQWTLQIFSLIQVASSGPTFRISAAPTFCCIGGKLNLASMWADSCGELNHIKARPNMVDLPTAIVENNDKTAQFGVFPKSGFGQTHLKSFKKNVIPLSWVVNKDSTHWWQSLMHCVAQSPPIINQETDAALLPGQAASQQLNEMNRDPRCVWSKSSEIKPKGCYVSLKENMF